MKSTALRYCVLLVLFFLFFILSNIWVYAQVPTVGDCMGAIPVCQDTFFQPNTSSGQGNYPNEIFGLQVCPHCLWGERNSTWYRFTVQTSGLLSFIITPIDLNDDYDWAVYNLTNHRCEDIYSHALEMQVSCNSAGDYAPSPNFLGETGAYNGPDDCNGGGSTNGPKWNIEIPVQEGETYVLYVSDWTQSPTGYSLDFSPSTAQIYDNVPPFIDTIFADYVSGCNENELDIEFSEVVNCNRVTPAFFDINGPGGPYEVDSVYGAACFVGAPMEKAFTLFVDHSFTSNGDYELILHTGINGITDACDNIAPADTVPFTLDLGAPIIDETNMVITNSTCGVPNGSITGLNVTGQSALTYFWTDQTGDTVGYEVDLIDVYSGSYTLEIHDEDSCITIGGPYSIQDEGAPVVDETNMVISPSLCSEANGSITGLTATGSTALTYEWRNSSGTLVGNDIDLIDVLADNYTLTVRDENTCEIVSGPYTISDIPGPMLVEDNMEILPSTCGQPNGSITGIFSSGSTALTYEWRNGSGTLAGNNIDLIGVLGDNYTLTIRDENDCEIVGGPYIIEEYPSAIVDATNININSSTCGNSDGWIMGLTVSGSGPFIYMWHNINDSLVGTEMDLMNIPGGSYILTVFDDNLCETMSGPYLVPDEGGPEFDLSQMLINPSNCYGTDGSITSINVTGTAPINYTWKNENNIIVGTSLDLLNVPMGQYTLEAIDSNSCISYSGPHTVDNLGGADILSVQSSNPTCEEANGRIIIDATGGIGTLEYTVDGVNWQAMEVFENLSPGTYTIQVLDEHGCITNYGSALVLQNEGLAVTVTAMSNSPVCEGDLLELNCDLPEAQYLWEGPDGYVSTQQNPVIQNTGLTAEGAYNLTVTTQPYNCQGLSSVDVEVVESFMMNLLVTPSMNPIYMGEEVMFTAVANPAGFPGIYLWRIDGVEVQRGQNSTYTTSTMMDGQAVTCELITSGGCILNNPAYSNAVVMVVNELPMYFPNSFRPGSAIPENQVFRPKTLLDNIVKYELLIYDRWGQKIFATNKLDKGWDGKQNGEECPVGVYVYVANYELQGNEVKAGETYTKKGNVILLK